MPFGVGGGQVVASGLNRELLVGVCSVRVVGAGESAAAWVNDRVLPLTGVAADASGGGPFWVGWRRTCVCGIWLGVARGTCRPGCALVAPPLIQMGSGWPVSVPICAARPVSAEADA